MVKKNWSLRLLKIFFISIFFSILILCLERINGIGIDYHPDATTYLDSLDESVNLIFFNDPLVYVGSFYYVFVNFLNGNVNFLIGFNIFLFAVTNSAIFNLVRKIYLKKSWLYYFSILIIIFDPYRAHLSIHVLKDTFIIFCLFFLCFSKNFIVNVLTAIQGMFLRFAFFIYVPMLFSLKKITTKNIISIFIVLFITTYLFIEEIILGISQGQQADMAFRSFDLVPNFMSYDEFGSLIRTIIWPFFRITGTAALFSPVYLLFIIQACALMYLAFVNRSYIKFTHIFLILPLAVLAYSTTGYNSYLRYTQPVLTILSVWIACLPSTYFKNVKTRMTSKIT